MGRGLRATMVVIIALVPVWEAMGLAQELGIGAAAFLRQGVDARALGMGGAFVAVTDGYSAIYWNPAGLARTSASQLGGAYTDLFGVGIYHNFVAGAMPFVVDSEQTPSLRIGLGAGYTGMTTEVRVTDSNGQEVGLVQYSERLVAAGMGVCLPSQICLGATAKVYSFLAPKVGVGGKDATASGFGFDLGLLTPLVPGFWLGIAAADVGNTRVRWHNTPTEPTDLVMGRYAVGVAFTQGDLSLAADYIYQPTADDFVRAGIEYFLGFVAVRGGVVKRLNGPLSFTAGAGIRALDLEIDVAWVQSIEFEAEGIKDTVVVSAHLAVGGF